MITSVPGPSSLIIGLQVSGLPINKFTFYGYIPKHKGRKLFLEEINNKSSDMSFPSWDNWINYCDDLKNDNPIVVESQKKNPIDLYYFMKIY